jgi:hypothetical protein
MKLYLIMMLLAASSFGGDSVKMWDGRERGMDLVTIGHKRVTVFLADGRTTVIGVPILVEKSNAYRLKQLEAACTADGTIGPSHPKNPRTKEK